LTLVQRQNGQIQVNIMSFAISLVENFIEIIF